MGKYLFASYARLEDTNLSCVLVLTSLLGPHELLSLRLQDGETALYKTVGAESIQDETRVSMCKLLLDNKADPKIETNVS